MKPLTLTAFFALALSAPVAAHNNLFLPGDAFFSAEFSKDFFNERKRDATALTVPYHRYAGNFMSCGFAGYENCKVVDVSKKTRANLESVHQILYRDFSPGAPRGADALDLTDGHEPGFPLFIYNREFPLSSPFGVKYNESWVEVQTDEAKMRHAIYDDIGGIDFVVDDWASARDIAPLAIGKGRAPMVSELGETGVVRKPIEVSGDAVMFVILASADVAEFARREQGLVFFVVTDEIRRYRFNRQGVAMPQKVDAKADDIAAKRRVIEVDQKLLRNAINLYAFNHGETPSAKQGLSALWKKPEIDCPAQWMPVMRAAVNDPWGRAYGWDGDVVFSLGPDGVESQDDFVEPFERSDDGRAGKAAELP